MFLGRPEFHRMGRFRGRGVSEDAAFLSRDWHFTVDAAKHRIGPFQEWPSFRGCGVSQSIVISRSICKSKDAAKQRVGPFIFIVWPRFSHMFLVFSCSLLTGQFFVFCNFIFRVARHNM